MSLLDGENIHFFPNLHVHIRAKRCLRTVYKSSSLNLDPILTKFELRLALARAHPQQVYA
jgi:hypothetical protein